MAGKKKKKKDKKNLSGSLTHIASHLVPSAIFAAVPRSASAPLSSTWPRTSASSPVAQAVGEAGNVGFAFVGNVQKSSSQAEVEGNQKEVTECFATPRAPLPSTSAQQPDEEDPAYEAVEVGGRSDSYEKRTKNDAKSENESQELVKTVNGQHRDEHFYDDVAEDWQDLPVVEPVYAKVDKTKKKSVLAQIQGSEHQKNDADEGSVIDISSSDEDLTDVTTNDEDSSVSSKARTKEVNTNIGIQKERSENPKLQKTRRQNKDDDSLEESNSKNVHSMIVKHEKLMDMTQEEQGKKSRKSSDKKKKSDSQLTDKSNALHAPHEARTRDDHGKETSENKASVELESNVISTKKRSRKSSLKKEAQIASEETRLGDNTTTTATHTLKPVVYENERPAKEFRQSERLGFEGISQNVGLSDFSEDEESYLLRLSQSKFEHRRTDFEKENFNETLMDGFDTNLNKELAGESNNFDLTEASPVSLQWSTGSLHDGYEKSDQRNPASLDQQGHSTETSEKIYIQQQKHLKELVRQQENVYKQQAEQQKQQQKQTERLAQQQQELQGQLRLLEEIQYNRVDTLSSAVSEHDFRIQKEMVEQQKEFLRSQQKQQLHYENHQERILQQQENLCSQIRQLELQMRGLQSNISSLTPKEKDLTEIRWQEQEIIRLLNEQKHHQEQYEQLHRQQLQQIQDKELKFQQERQSLQVQQDFLKSKLIEQEEKSKQLEKKLYNVSSKEKRHHMSEESEVSQVLHAGSYEGDEVDAVPVPRKQTKKPSTANKRIHEALTDNSRLLEVNASLQQENAVLKQYSEALQKGSAGGSSLIMQQQIKDLQEEKIVLQETVHRVNVELSRYQTKYRKATAEDFPVMLSKTKTREPSPWLVNTKFLAPLFLAYDDRLKEREDIIKTYDEELSSFKTRLMEIVKENQDLHMRLTQSKPDALHLDEWQQLQEQAKLVVEENVLLMKQRDQQQRKLKELQRSHGQDVSKLSMRIATLESEKRSLETELEDSQCSFANLSQKYKEMVDEEETKINVEAHFSMIDECRSVMQDLNSKKNSEIEDLESRLNVVQEEKQNLASSLAESKAHISQLTKEMDLHKKTQRKLERKTMFLERKLEHILEREVTAQQTLSEVLKVAEKTAEERDSFEEFAKSQELKQRKSKSLIHQGDLSILGLQEKLKQNKKKLNHKVASITGRLNDKEKEVNKMKEDYEQEINRLRDLVRKKQSKIDAIMGERRIFDEQLDMVWKKADQDNQKMMNTVGENKSTREEQ